MSVYTPTLFIKGAEAATATTWSDHYQLLWEGWLPAADQPVQDDTNNLATHGYVQDLLDQLSTSLTDSITSSIAVEKSAAEAAEAAAAASAASVQREQINGVAGLDASGKLYVGRLPTGYIRNDPNGLAGLDADGLIEDMRIPPTVMKLGQTGIAGSVYVDPAGSDTMNTGTSALSPFQTFQKAFDFLAAQGPVLQGNWTVYAAGGTYPIFLGQQTMETRSVNKVVVRGPDVGGSPNVPLAIIDGAGGGNYAHGLSASGIGVQVEFRDLKFINFNGDPAGNSRIGCLGEHSAWVNFNNVHATGATWCGAYAFNTVRAYVTGGIYDACRTGVIPNATEMTIQSGTMFKNCTQQGVWWSRGSQGHCDNATFQDNVVGITVGESSRVDTITNNFKRNGIAVQTRTNGVFGEGGVGNDNIYNDGTADANTQKFDFAAGSGYSNDLETAQNWVRYGYDRTTRTNAAVTTLQTLSTPYTIKAGRMAGPGKSCRVTVYGTILCTAGSTISVGFGNLLETLAVTAAEPATVSFKFEAILHEVGGGYRTFGTITHGLNHNRLHTTGGGAFDKTIAQAITVQAQLAATTDVLTIYRTDVEFMG